MPQSFLFVPGDSERKLAKAASAAGAVILDLEDAVAPDRKAAARALVVAWLRAAAPGGPAAWVRINPPGDPAAELDLAALAGVPVAGIVLPKCRGPEDVRALAARLDALGRAAAQAGILPLVTETPEAALRVAEYRHGAPRLAGLTWGAEDLGAALGTGAARDADGAWLPLYEQLRGQVRLAAAAAGVPAIDTVYTDVADLDGLRRYVAGSRRLGFAGMLALHPAQVAPIEEGFRPTAAELEHARRVVAAFDAAGGAGVVSLEGRMLDRPHLARARELLRRPGRGGA